MTHSSTIIAPIHVSESEIKLIDSGYTHQWFITHNKRLIVALSKLGLDTNKRFEYQANIQHRNRLNNVVTCGRYSGFERIDKKWLNSGLASQCAKDKAACCQILDSIYASRGETIESQRALERKYPCSTEEQQNEFLMQYNKEK